MFPLIKLAKKLKVLIVIAAGMAFCLLFPLIKLAKKLKVLKLSLPFYCFLFPLIKLAKKLKVLIAKAKAKGRFPKRFH